jgi:PAS domain S-box-containing protein
MSTSTDPLEVLKILIVDDDEDDFVLLRESLGKLAAWKFELTWIARYEEAIEALCTNTFTLCFSDYRLGIKNGIELIRESQAKNCTTPIILLTGRGTHTIDMEATKAGAFDYLVKDQVNAHTLERTIRYSLERMQNLEKLLASERRYRRFFEKSIDVVFIAREDTTITTINPAVKDLLNFSVEECIGKRKLLDFFRHDKTKRLFMDTLVKEGEVENFEVRLVSSDEQTVTCLVNASLEKNGGDELFLQGILHNITDLKRSERATLQNEKLAATGRFIQTLAHEVRNPLKNIKMAVQQLQNPNNRVDEQVLWEIVERSEVKIDNLITELLQSSNAAVMSLQKLSLNGIVEELVNSVRDKATLRHIAVTLTPTVTETMIIRADPVKLKMALSNIIVNAIEAVSPDIGKVDIYFRAAGAKAELLIRDNGIGITAENKEKLFEPYFTSKRSGIGLGLATTLNILRAHHAEIEVESEPGKGATFKVVFDLVERHMAGGDEQVTAIEPTAK